MGLATHLPPFCSCTGISWGDLFLYLYLGLSNYEVYAYQDCRYLSGTGAHYLSVHLLEIRSDYLIARFKWLILTFLFANEDYTVCETGEWGKSKV